jgi:hypothetical protein
VCWYLSGGATLGLTEQTNWQNIAITIARAKITEAGMTKYTV